MDNKETQTAKAADPAAPWRLEIHVFTMHETFLTQNEIIIEHIGIAAYCSPRTGRSHKINQLLPKRLSTT